MRRVDGDGGRSEPRPVGDDGRIELVDSEGTLIDEEMVEVIPPRWADEWDVRADERTG